MIRIVASFGISKGRMALQLHYSISSDISRTWYFSIQDSNYHEKKLLKRKICLLRLFEKWKGALDIDEVF